VTPLLKGVRLETAYIKKVTKRGLEPIAVSRLRRRRKPDERILTPAHETPKNILITKALRALTPHPCRGLARSRSLGPAGLRLRRIPIVAFPKQR
jgi:hypothetical protein